MIPTAKYWDVFANPRKRKATKKMLKLWETVYLMGVKDDDDFEKKILRAFVAAHPADDPARIDLPADIRASRLRRLAFRIAYCTDMYFQMGEADREKVMEASSNPDDLPDLLETLGDVEGAYILNRKRLM